MNAINDQDKMLELLSVEEGEQLTYVEQLEKFNEHRRERTADEPMPEDFL